jgi:hypothetical protein
LTDPSPTSGRFPLPTQRPHARRPSPLPPGPPAVSSTPLVFPCHSSPCSPTSNSLLGRQAVAITRRFHHSCEPKLQIPSRFGPNRRSLSAPSLTHSSAHPLIPFSGPNTQRYEFAADTEAAPPPVAPWTRHGKPSSTKIMHTSSSYTDARRTNLPRHRRSPKPSPSSASEPQTAAGDREPLITGETPSPSFRVR